MAKSHNQSRLFNYTNAIISVLRIRSVHPMEARKLQSWHWDIICGLPPMPSAITCRTFSQSRSGVLLNILVS